MEVAVSVNDSRGLSPSVQQHRHSRYSTPDTPTARSPNRVEPTATSPIIPSLQEPNSTNNSPSTQNQHQPQEERLVGTMEADGQDHDRMDTDDESETSASGADSPQHHTRTSGTAALEVPAAQDGEAMDTTPDSPDAGDVRLPPSLYNENQEPSNSQDVDGDSSVNHNLVRSNSRGSTVASRSPTNTPPPNNAPDTFLSVIIDPSTGQVADTARVAQAAEEWPSLFPSQTQPNTTQNPPETQVPAEQEGDRSGGQEEDSPDEDSADEDEQPYWANFVDDKSVPSDEESKLIEQDIGERSAIDHEHWETLAFEPLDDPEYIPTATGRIEWTLKGFHGTPEKPNKETVMRSPSVSIGGYYWNIKVYPRGNENTDSMSVYVECSTSHRDAEPKKREGETSNSGSSKPTPHSEAEQPIQNQHESEAAAPAVSSTDPRIENDQLMETTEVSESTPTVAIEDVAESQPSWEVPAQVLCIAYNPEEPRVHAYQKVTHRYHKDTPDWGWTRFHGPWDRLHRRERMQRQAMLRNDTLSFTAYIRTVKDDTAALWWHSPANQPEWDSFERLGLNRLWVGSPESSAVLSAVSTWLHISPYCSSIVNSLGTARSEPRQIRDRPFHEELEHLRGQLASPLKETDESPSLMNVAEMLDWNDAGDCEPDVVSNLDILRRTLSCEALRIRDITDLKDIFEDILLLRQPDPAPIATPQTVNGEQQGLTESSSVQQAVNAASSYLRIDTAIELPAVLQVELHRQNYDMESRKWKKLSHRISIDDVVTFPVHDSNETAYTLLGLVVHSGDIESKDYYSVIRSKGPGSRWIKYAGDKTSRGVECLTSKQALDAHEGNDTVNTTAAVAYLVTYVRTDLLSKIPLDPKDSESAASRNSEPLGDVPKSIRDDVQVPVYVYQSSVFRDHQGLGLSDWTLREKDDKRLLKLEVADSISLGDLVDAIDNARRIAKPATTGKYALWFLDTVRGNLAMENTVRAPEMTPVNIRGPGTRLKDTHSFYGVCRIWLDDNTPIQPEEAMDPPPPQARAPAPDASAPQTPPPLDDTMQVDEDAAENAASTANVTGAQTQQPAEAAPAEVQPHPVDDVDTVMEGNADPDAVQGSSPPAPQRSWNTSLDTKVLGTFDNVFIFLKSFDAENQTLAGVKTFWVKQNDRVGYTIRQAMAWEDDMRIEIYHEQTLSTLESVRSGSSFQDISGASNYILIVQKRLDTKDDSRLVAAGKPTTIPAFFNYACATCDPAYLQPNLTRSYFASPYFSGSLAYGRPHGHGTLITTVGDAYTGTFVSGTKCGQGTMRFANGDTYTGSWANDDPDGQGEMVYAKTGNVYTGGWRKRKRHGKGVMKFEVADEEERLCGICYEEEMDCCFYDCGHVAACEGCARQVDVCPVCRKGVKAVIRIWKS